MQSMLGIVEAMGSFQWKQNIRDIILDGNSLVYRCLENGAAGDCLDATLCHFRSPTLSDKSEKKIMKSGEFFVEKE